MDANGLRFWLLADADHWLARQRAVYDRGCRVLRLATQRTLAAPADPAAAHAAANTALERIPRAVDGTGAVAHWDGTAQAIVVRSSLPGEAVTLALEETPRDFCVGYDGILYVLLSDRIRLHDLRGRWADDTVAAGGFNPWRLAPDPTGGIWVLERANGRMARLSGRPLPHRPFVEYAPGVFRPDPENCNPPELRVMDDLGWPDGERPVALDFHSQGGLALLSWAGDGEARLRRFDTRTERLGPGFDLVGARYAYAIGWIDANQVALRMPERRDAPIFALDTADRANAVEPSGDIYPLSAHAMEAPFAHRIDGPPFYPVELSEEALGAEPLYRLSLSNLARRGEARNFDGAQARLLDSGSQETVWHRLYAEASIPPRSGFIVWLAATAEPVPPTAGDADEWLPHRFGSGIPAVPEPHVAEAAWEHFASELPNHPGLGPWPSEAGRVGLFSVLVQNPRRRVRPLRGRFLWVRVELFGDGRVGPEIAALRAYAGRFSYRDHYLPRLYRESVYGPAAEAPGDRIGELALAAGAELDAAAIPGASLIARLEQIGLQLGTAPEIVVERAGQCWLLRDATSARAWRLLREQDVVGVYRPRATAADFLERMLGNFEGVLTQMEDRIAAAHLLTDPVSTPEEYLDWLAKWVGVAFDPALPQQRRRAWLAKASQMARCHGTKRGLELALDIASGGGVRGGEIVVLEDFRLRRLLSTLLGVDLSDDNDALLPGLVQSGNSVVGDTLVLGEAEQTELLALFRAEVASAAENAAVLAFYDRLAFRATVLVHQSVTPQDLGLIRRVVELEAPAHVDVRVETATWPFLVGIASLVGVDTYLGPPEVPRPARLDVSGLGQGDYVIGPTSLDPRFAGAASPAPPPVLPTADAGGDRTVAFGASFNLDGGQSHAAPGRKLSSYVWRRLPQQ